MEQNESVPKNKLQMLTVLHFAITLPLVIFLGLAYFGTTQEDFSGDAALSDMLLILVPVLAIMGYVMGVFLFKKQLAKIIKLESLNDKLLQYQTASLVQYALLEGPGLFAAVAYFLTGELVFAGITLAIIVLLVMNRPTKFKTVSDLALSQAEKSLLD